jgi:RHS repeat-associated protein
MHIFEEMFTMRDTLAASITSLETQVSTTRRVSAVMQNLSFFALALLAWCVIAPNTPAQNIQYNPGNIGSGLDNSLQIQLRAYPGRGQASLPITLYYSSKVWRIKYTGTIYNPYDRLLSEPMTQAMYAEYSAAGWTSSLGIPFIEWPESNQVYDYRGKSVCLDCHNPAFSPDNYWKVPRLTLHMPDGSAHELRRDDTPYTGPVNNSGIYYAVDSSRLRYDTATATLYLPDGARYVLGESTVQVIDRNGNTLSYDRGTGQWTDTLGRAISVPPLTGYPGDYTYSVPGVGGIPVSYTFRWTYLSNVLEPDPVTGAIPQLGYAGGHYTNGTPSVNNPPQPLPAPHLFQTTENSEGMNDYVIASPALFNPGVLSEIVLPNGTSYKFTYNEYGEIARVTYPTGGFEQYKYGQVLTVTSLDSPYDQGNRGAISRWVSPNGTGTDRVQWQYGVTYNANSNLYKQWMIAPDNTYTERFLFKAAPTSQYTNLNYPKFGFEDPRNGMVYEDCFYQYQNGPMLQRHLIGSTYTSRNVTVSFNGQTTTAPALRNPRTTKEVSLLIDTGGEALAKTLTYAYDTRYQLSTGLDRTASTESHFATVDQPTAQFGAISAIPSGMIASTAVTTYLDDANYRDRNILGLATSVILQDTYGQPVRKTVTAYDETPLQPYNDFGGDWNDPGTYRGNATTTRRYVDASANLPLTQECPVGVCLDTHSSFDQVGNVWKFKNERGLESQLEFAATYKHAYPTRTTTAVPDPLGTNGSNTAFTSTSVFDSATGQMRSTTDANGLTTYFSYADEQNVPDPLNRLRKVTRPDNSVTTYDYHDAVNDTYLETKSSFDAGRSTTVRQYFDKLGRDVRAFAYENTDPDARWMVTDTYYDLMGRVRQVSNPYRTATPGATPPPSCSVCTTNVYDVLGRVTLVTLPDLTTAQTNYRGSYTTITDQAGKQRRQQVDALGRIVRVDEPDASGNLGAQPTYYDYDTQGNLIHITQGPDPSDPNHTLQHRYFKYDALSRLTYEFQVEPKAAPFFASDSLTGNSQWTRKLVYDETGPNGGNNMGLLTSMYDARQVRTRYRFYDNLGRVTEVSFSDGTPTLTNYYDQNRAGYQFNKGHLTEVHTDAAISQGQIAAIPATSQIYDYDLMGRITHQQQLVGAQTYTLSYDYYIGGQLKSETYPSGRVVNYSYDDAARLSGTASGSKNYASNFLYGSRGVLTSMTYGNGAVESYDYNSRLQLTNLSLTKDSNTIQRYEYRFGQVNADGTVDETKNNGQVARIEGFSSGGKQWQQRFAYDSLGRLSQASEYRGDNGQQSYLINYDYDAFGNRYQKLSNNQANPLGYVRVEDGDISKTTNRFTFPEIDYDDAGNIKVDNKFKARQYLYDANNRLRWAALPDETGAATSVYDGAGQRVATIVNGATSYMVYDAMGKLVAEYGASASSTSGTNYLMSDYQGSTRVVTNANGGVISRQDYQPFGEELGSVGMRSSDPFYGGANSARQKYAGMEKDEASGMAHTLWRKYDGTSGRWTSPDPYGGSMELASPQSFNRYSYVNNDPINHVDPTGLMLSDIGVTQTADPEEAQILEHQSLRNLQISVNADYARRHNGKVSYKGDHATFTLTQPQHLSTALDESVYKESATGQHDESSTDDQDDELQHRKRKKPRSQQPQAPSLPSFSLPNIVSVKRDGGIVTTIDKWGNVDVMMIWEYKRRGWEFKRQQHENDDRWENRRKWDICMRRYADIYQPQLDSALQNWDDSTWSGIPAVWNVIYFSRLYNRINNIVSEFKKISANNCGTEP